MTDDAQSDRKSRNDITKYRAQMVSGKDVSGANATAGQANSPIVGYLIKNNILLDEKIDPAQINHRP